MHRTGKDNRFIIDSEYHLYFDIPIYSYSIVISKKFLFKDTENENVVMNEDGMNGIDSTEANDKIAMSDDDVKPNPASNISSLVIEEVEVSVPEMNLSDIDRENVSLYQNLYFRSGKILPRVGKYTNIINFPFIDAWLIYTSGWEYWAKTRGRERHRKQ